MLVRASPLRSGEASGGSAPFARRRPRVRRLRSGDRRSPGRVSARRQVPAVTAPSTVIGNVSRTHRPCGACGRLVEACPHYGPKRAAGERNRAAWRARAAAARTRARADIAFLTDPKQAGRRIPIPAPAPKIGPKRVWTSKLTEDDVRAIRASMETTADLARRYGLTPSAMSAVRLGRSWKGVR